MHLTILHYQIFTLVFTYVCALDLEALTTNNSKSYVNLTKDEKTALEEHSSDQSIVIKQADKGGGVVIMDHCYYMQEANRILGDNITYQKLKTNPSILFQQELLTLLEDGRSKGILEENEFHFLNIQDPKFPIFYFQPKIHKNLTDPPEGQ